MDSSYDKTHESLYKYNESVAEDMATLCAPLSEYFGIKMFGYSKTFLDGRFFFVSNQLHFSRLFLQFILQENGIIWEESVPLQHSQSSESMIPGLWPEVHNAPIGQLLQNHGFWNGFHFARIHQDSLELWSFIADVDSSNMQELYIRNQGTLLKFVQFFNAQAKEIMKCNQGDHTIFNKY